MGTADLNREITEGDGEEVANLITRGFKSRAFYLPGGRRESQVVSNRKEDYTLPPREPL